MEYIKLTESSNSKGLVNMVHWYRHSRPFHDHHPMCNCFGAGSPSTMCCEWYYKDHKDNKWIPGSPFLPIWVGNGFDLSHYYKWKKRNPIFALFLLGCYSSMKFNMSASFWNLWSL